MSDAQPYHKDEDLYRQWFDSVYDTNQIYLDQADYQAAERLYKRLGRRISRDLQKWIDAANDVGRQG